MTKKLVFAFSFLSLIVLSAYTVSIYPRELEAISPAGQQHFLGEIPSPDNTRSLVVRAERDFGPDGSLMVAYYLKDQGREVPIFDGPTYVDPSGQGPFVFWLNDAVAVVGEALYDVTKMQRVIEQIPLSCIAAASIDPTKSMFAVLGKSQDDGLSIEAWLYDLSSTSWRKICSYKKKQTVGELAASVAWDKQGNVYFDGENSQGQPAIWMYSTRDSKSKVFKELAAIPQGSPNGVFLAYRQADHYFASQRTLPEKTILVNLETGKTLGELEGYWPIIWSEDGSYFAQRFHDGMKVYHIFSSRFEQAMSIDGQSGRLVIPIRLARNSLSVARLETSAQGVVSAATQVIDLPDRQN